MNVSLVFSNTMTRFRPHPEHPVSVTFETEQTCVNVVKVWCTFEHENCDILDVIVKIKNPVYMQCMAILLIILGQSSIVFL